MELKYFTAWWRWHYWPGRTHCRCQCCCWAWPSSPCHWSWSPQSWSQSTMWWYHQHSHSVIDDSISLSQPQIPCLSCVCKLRSELILISPRPNDTIQSDERSAHSKARRALIGPNHPKDGRINQWERRVTVWRYHCPTTHAMRDWEKGSRNLAYSGLAYKSSPNHVKSDYALIRVEMMSDRPGGRPGPGLDVSFSTNRSFI